MPKQLSCLGELKMEERILKFLTVGDKIKIIDKVERGLKRKTSRVHSVLLPEHYRQ